MKKGKFLYIREHDANSNEIKLFLDVKDQTFNSSFYEYPVSSHEDFTRNCRSWFLGFDELEAVMKEIGFALVEKKSSKGEDWEAHGWLYQALWQKM